MLSLKRLLYIVLIVAALGGAFLIYNKNETRMAGLQVQSSFSPERDFIEIKQMDSGEKPKVWILGDSEDERLGKIYDNVRQFCRDIHLPAAEGTRLDIDSVKPQDLVVFCDDSITRRADPAELETFIAGGGRVILAAGLAEGDGDARLWPVFGLREKSGREDYKKLVFEKPLLPLQPERAVYDGSGASARIKVRSDASVYIRAAGKGSPVLYTYDYKKGGVCLINGTFLTDVRCMGLLSGAVSALLPDFIYPVLGVKAVFLDNFPMVTFEDDEFFRKVYGYSTEGFVRDVVWPGFQGISLRTGTPYTSSILAIASSEESFPNVSDGLFTVIGRSALQFGGELVYGASCPEDGTICFNKRFMDRFSVIFKKYAIQGLVMETDNFSLEMLQAPGAEIRSVRGMLDSPLTRLSWDENRTVFPGATAGNSMEDGNLFAISSVLGAYGMISHVFNVNTLISRDGDKAAWDSGKKQVGLFESEILARTPWLEGRTLSETEGDVRSYQNLDYGWTGSGNKLELNCSGAAKGQAFFYHTGRRISGAEGLTFQEVGNGYYLLRIQESRCVITLEEEK